LKKPRSRRRLPGSCCSGFSTCRSTPICADGRIRYREDIVNGLEKAPEAFIGMLEGRNFGKVIVRVDA
jgi:hypothetical protein